MAVSCASGAHVPKVRPAPLLADHHFASAWPKVQAPIKGEEAKMATEVMAAPVAGTGGKIKSELMEQRVRAARWFLLPMLVALAVVAGWPLLRSIYFSFTDASLNDLAGAEWIGVGNYFRVQVLDSGAVRYRGLLVDPAWWNAVWNTLRFAVVSVSFEAVLGMIVALDAKRPVRHSQ